MFAALFILFFGAQMGITGFQFNLQPILQMVAGYLHPGRPIGMHSVLHAIHPTPRLLSTQCLTF